MTDASLLRALLLPFRLAPLLLIVVFAVLLRLALYAGLFGLPVLVIVGSWFFKYAFVLLDHAANGRPDAPVLSIEDANPLGETRPLLYGVVIAAFYFASGALGDVTGPGTVLVLHVLGLAVLPAIIATHSITGSFANALDPRAIAAMIRGLGWCYALVLGVAIACYWAGRVVAFDGGALGVMPRMAVLMLLWLTTFALLGSVIYVRRAALGFEPEQSPERRQGRDDTERDRERDKFIDRVFAECHDGRVTNAWATIEQRANGNADALTEYEWIYRRVVGWPNPRLAHRIAQVMLPPLLAARRNGEALRLVKARLQADGEFRPLRSAELLRLAELARDGGDRPLARALLQDFDRHFPNDAGREIARRLVEQLKR